MSVALPKISESQRDHLRTGRGFCARRPFPDHGAILQVLIVSQPGAEQILLLSLVCLLQFCGAVRTVLTFAAELIPLLFVGCA